MPQPEWIVIVLVFISLLIMYVNPKKRDKDFDVEQTILDWEQKKLDTKIATEKAIKREKLRKRQKKIKAEAEELKSNQKELF